MEWNENGRKKHNTAKARKQEPTQQPRRDSQTERQRMRKNGIKIYTTNHYVWCVLKSWKSKECTSFYGITIARRLSGWNKMIATKKQQQLKNSIHLTRFRWKSHRKIIKNKKSNAITSHGRSHQCTHSSCEPTLFEWLASFNGSCYIFVVAITCKRLRAWESKYWTCQRLELIWTSRTTWRALLLLTMCMAYLATSALSLKFTYIEF